MGFGRRGTSVYNQVSAQHRYFSSHRKKLQDGAREPVRARTEGCSSELTAARTEAKSSSSLAKLMNGANCTALEVMRNEEASEEVLGSVAIHRGSVIIH